MAGNESPGKHQPVIIGLSVFSEANKRIEANGYTKKFILVDENTLMHCLPLIIEGIPALKEAEIMEIESGEENKSIEICTGLWKTLTELGADRKSLLVNAGGGVVCDLGGFVASTFKRGIDFMNFPTSLLAQVDASVGGKTGINLEGYKNELGTFYNPETVFVYPPFLNTLPKRQLLSGFAEMLKHSLISDREYWNSLKNTDIVNESDLQGAIERSVQIKGEIVDSDPQESGNRKKLNFGHTIGHALESYYLKSGADMLLHGEAVALGMVAESYLSFKHEGLPENYLEEINEYLLNVYSFRLPEFDCEEVIQLMKHDKKNTGSALNFTLLKEIGKSKIDCFCTPKDIETALIYLKEKSGLHKKKA